MAQNIVDADTLARGVDVDKSLHPCAVATEFDSAFPSVSQEWLRMCCNLALCKLTWAKGRQ